jgi:hypothetical protein
MEQRQEPECCPGAGTLETARTWRLWQTEVERRIGAQFARREVRWRAWAYIRGLLSPAERKNGWQIRLRTWPSWRTLPRDIACTRCCG